MARTLSSSLSLYLPGSSASVLDISASTRMCDRWSRLIRRATSPSSDASPFPENETYTSLIPWDWQKSRNASAAPGTARTVGVFHTQRPCTGPCASAAKARPQKAPRKVQIKKEYVRKRAAHQNESSDRQRRASGLTGENSTSSVPVTTRLSGTSTIPNGRGTPLSRRKPSPRFWNE